MAKKKGTTKNTSKKKAKKSSVQKKASSKKGNSKKKGKKRFQSPKGMSDILPREQYLWDAVRVKIEDFATYYNFERIDTPILEDIDLFERSVGEATDIVEKQMYTLKTRGGDELVMRPEGTAAVMRAYIEHGLFSLGSPARLYYTGPMFRHENTQKWRSRQFHQAGFEIIGSAGAVYDAQIILLMYRILESLKLKNLSIHINSIGCKTCRAQYRNRLTNYYKQRLNQVCKDCKERFSKNPMRLLDCKEDAEGPVRQGAPVIIDDLCGACHGHFKSVLEFLDALKLPYRLDPYLVRGLDYYTRTVFEIIPHSVDDDVASASQNTLASGGRYDYLAEQLGGKETPGVGGAMGLDRIIEYAKELNAIKKSENPPKVYIVQLGDLAKRRSLLLLEELRKANITAAESFGRDSIKAQLRVADKAGAEFALIIGQKEAHEGNVIIRDMESGSQETVPVEKLMDTLKKKLKKK